MTKPNNIEALRTRIDEIDAAIVDLLNQRAQLALEIRKLKPQHNLALYDPKREAQILETLCTYNRSLEGRLYDEHIQEIYAAILKVMKELP